MIWPDADAYARRCRYYQTVALAVGVPVFWIEDAAQMIALRVWKRGNDGAGTVRSAAIDAARFFGPVNRYGTPRLNPESLDHLAGWCACS